MLLLSCIEISINLSRFVRRYAVNDCRFSHRMYGQTLSFRDTDDFEHQCGGTMSDHDLPFLCEILKNLQHIHVIGFCTVFLKYGYGIAT